MKRYRVNVMILNYNGAELLERFLPGLLRAVKASRHETRLSVLDNCSTDLSEFIVRNRFPEVEFIKAQENKILASYNEAAAACDDDILILINNDIGAENDFVDPLVEFFEKGDDVFAVAPYTNKAVARFHYGVLSSDINYAGHERAWGTPSYTLNVSMGAFDRKKFLEIGGYDYLYFPGYCEDLDLSYRAWKRGWKLYYQPLSRISHLGSATFKKHFNEDKLKTIAFRNGMLFMMKNIDSLALRVRFWLSTYLRVAAAAALGRRAVVNGFREAMQMKPGVRVSRQAAASHVRLRDAQLLPIFASPQTLDRAFHAGH